VPLSAPISAISRAGDRFSKGRMIISLVSLFLCCSPPAERSSSSTEHRVSVESFQLIDSASFNDSIVAAVRDGYRWPWDPIRVAQEFLGSPASRTVRIEREDDPGERPDSTTVIVLEDGYLDDSVRGRWTEFRQVRMGDGTWRIVEVRRAYRCWRGYHQDSFSKELCP
jgi:hypothetical protein